MIDTLKNLLGLGPKTDLGQMIREGAIILDVRSKKEFDSGHIRGAMNISVDQLASTLGKLPDKNKAIITCCASGMRSASAKNILEASGYTKVVNGGSWRNLEQYK